MQSRFLAPLAALFLSGAACQAGDLTREPTSDVGGADDGGASACIAIEEPALEASFSLGPLSPEGCAMPLVFDGVVEMMGEYEGDARHIRPFPSEVGPCVADDYVVSFRAPEAIADRVRAIPAGALVHVVAPGFQTPSGISITNLPSFGGASNPVADDLGPWLAIDYAGETGAAGPGDLVMSTPFQCSDPDDADSNATYAFDVESFDTGERARAQSGTWETLTVTTGPAAASYAIVNAGIGQNESVSGWRNFSLFRID